MGATIVLEACSSYLNLSDSVECPLQIFQFQDSKKLTFCFCWCPFWTRSTVGCWSHKATHIGQRTGECQSPIIYSQEKFSQLLKRVRAVLVSMKYGDTVSRWYKWISFYVISITWLMTLAGCPCATQVLSSLKQPLLALESFDQEQPGTCRKRFSMRRV